MKQTKKKLKMECSQFFWGEEQPNGKKQPVHNVFVNRIERTRAKEMMEKKKSEHCTVD